MFSLLIQLAFRICQHCSLRMLKFIWHPFAHVQQFDFFSDGTVFKFIFVTKILLHRPYEAFENSNTDIEGLSSHLWKIYTPVVFWVEYRRELCFPWEEVFKAARDENYFRPVAVLFQKKKKRRKDGRTNIRDVHASWKKVKCLYLHSTDNAFTQHNHEKYSLQTKGQMPVDKRFSKCESPSWLVANSLRGW